MTEGNRGRYTPKPKEGNSKPRSPTEPIGIHVSGHMAEPPTGDTRLAQQLLTPPNTLIGKKKERPLSWEAEPESWRKAVCVANGGLTRFEPEQTIMYPTMPPVLSARPHCCESDDCSKNRDSLTSEAALTSSYSSALSDDTSSENPDSIESGCGSTTPDRNSAPSGTADVTGLSARLPVATNSEDSGDSTRHFGTRRCANLTAGEEPYPQLPTCEASTSAELPNLNLDPFDSGQDYISLSNFLDNEDLPSEASQPDHISVNSLRTEPRLCDEQLALVKLIMDGNNVFYTGSAGCGKSTVLKRSVTLLRREGKKVDILAPTGRAALEINGRTLYNYAGWIPRSLAQPLWSLENNARGKKVRKRLGATDVLIIDEISMVANHIFERLNCIMKSARGSQKPFGGVQLIVTGDFLQLPPVNAFEYCLMCGTILEPASWEDRFSCDKCSAQHDEDDKWAFCSAAWPECEFQHVNLKVIHRQQDGDFRSFLERRRLELPWTDDEERLILDHESETEGAVKLFPRRAEVKATNDMELAKLPVRTLTYLCVDDFFWNKDHENLGDRKTRCLSPMSHALEALEDHCLEPKLELKEGMPVILLVNWDLESSLANGSQGTIVGFEKHDPKLFPEVPRDWEYWARKNGLARVFVDRTVAKEWPVVQFLNGRKRTIYPRCMMYELGDDEPYSLLSRTQIPLAAGWAMTVHKAQGMTLSRVTVDLSHSFESGQEYVALSRAETLRGLKVDGLPRQRRSPNKRVIEFLEENGVMPTFDRDVSDTFED